MCVASEAPTSPKGTSTNIPQTFMNAGFNTFRINIMMERIVPNQLTNSLDQAYFRDMDNVRDHTEHSSPVS